MGGASVIALACACYVSVSSVRLEFVARRRVAQEKKMYRCCVYVCTYVCSKRMASQVRMYVPGARCVRSSKLL